ncbi:CHAT domain-containing protein [Rhizoctonia solani]|nr:CHAT domain-containing protein [Rhizoctonia solani]
MVEQPSKASSAVIPQGHILYNLGIDVEPLEDESSEEEYLDEECEPSHQEIQMSLFGLMGRPYEFQDFDESQLILARVLSITPDEDPSAALIYEIFENLCNHHPQRIQDADNHIYSAPFIIQTKDDPKLTYELGMIHKEEYKRAGQLGKLERAIGCMRKAVESAEEMDPNLPEYLFGLGETLYERFERFSEIDSLEDAIKYQYHAIALLPDPEAHFLSSLGYSLLQRFIITGDRSDLEQAIEIQEQSVTSFIEDTERAYVCRANLAASLLVRFEDSSDPLDLDRAIELYEYTLQSNLEFDIRATTSNNIGAALQKKSMHLIDINTINRAITHQERAVASISDNNTNKPRFLTNLGCSLHIKYEHLGDMADIQSAINYQLAALSLLPKKHNLRPMILNDLGKSYLLRFGGSGEPADIEECLGYLSQAVELTPKGSPERAKWLFNQGNALRQKFEAQGQLADIDNSIAVHYEAIFATSEAHMDRAERLDHLGNAYMSRFERLEVIADLDNAIMQYRTASSIYGSGNKRAQATLNNLGSALCIKFKYLGRYHDIDESITVIREAIQLSAKQSHVPTLLNSLSVSLWFKYKRTKDIEDIDESISSLQHAISLTPDSHPDMPTWLHSISSSLHLRYVHSGSLDDINLAIEHRTRAVRLTPEYHSERPALLRALGDALGWRYSALGEQEGAELDDMVDAYRQAALSSVGRPRERFEAAFSWAQTLSLQGESPLEAYKVAFTIIPQVVWMGTTIDQRYLEVAPLSRLTTRAVSCAIAEGEYSLALEWFEEGRSIVWRQTLDLRTPLEELRELERVARGLDQAGSSKPLHSAPPAVVNTLEQAAQAHHRLAEGWDVLLDEVRQIDGFANFLKAKKASTLLKAAYDGPVIAVNVNETRCDALILANCGTHLDHVPLPELSYERTSNAQKELMNFLMLAGFVIVRKDDHLFQMNQAQQMITSGTFIVIYPTINGLLASSPSSEEFSGILTIGQASTPGLSSLPGTKQELKSIARHAGSLRLTQLVDHSATPEAVLHAINTHSWVHFACHASQSYEDPTSSGFYLHNGTLDLNDITKQALGRKDLAFLSACQTATGALDLPEEAVHLAAGMIMAGYPTVIATMWSIGDSDAPLIAEHTYAEILMGGKPNSSKACRALHRALGVLRDKVGERAFVSWVPYIHIGI